MSKKLLFISHAAPEDNDLSGWLASKLRLLGYEVWMDVKNLRADSSFWNEIELKMRDESIRDEVESAIDMRKSFCYETNVNSTPLYWPDKFKQNNCRLELAFFCLDATDKVKERVQIRIENGDHFVSGYEIASRPIGR